MWTIFKVFIEFFTILLILCFDFLTTRHMDLLKNILFIYLTAQGLSCSMWDLVP